MRTEKEMLDLILSFALQDERIRVVVMNGSRVNPNIPTDIFQDYDIVYFVEDVRPFIHDLDLIRYFGETIIYQLPDEIENDSPGDSGSYAYLMQFADANRIDLSFRALTHLQDDLHADSLTRVLLDKDNLCGDLPPSSVESYLPVPPTEKQFDDCCNEFWWVQPYVAKGLWRGELIGPHTLLEIIRDELLKMLTWYYGVRTDFKCAPGKHGRFFPDVLEAELWEMVRESYPTYETRAVWASMFTMGDLFRTTANVIASHFGYSYPKGDDARVLAFLRKVRDLPPDTSDFDL